MKRWNKTRRVEGWRRAARTADTILVLIVSCFICLFMVCFVLFLLVCFFYIPISIIGFFYVNTQYMLPIAHIYMYSFVYIFFLTTLIFVFSFFFCLFRCFVLFFFDCAYFNKVWTRTIFVCFFLFVGCF